MELSDCRYLTLDLMTKPRVWEDSTKVKNRVAWAPLSVNLGRTLSWSFEQARILEVAKENSQGKGAIFHIF